MATSIVQTSDSFTTKDILILDWDIIYNSIFRTDISLYFNTDLSTIEANYIAESGSGNYIEVSLSDGTNDYIMTLISRLSNITDLNNTQINDGDDNVYVENNLLLVRFDYTEHSFTTLTENLNDYFIKVKINDTLAHVLVFDTNDTNNVSGILNRTISDPNDINIIGTTLDLTDSGSLVLNSGIDTGYWFDSNDIVTIYPFNGASGIGISSVTPSSINNSVSLSTRNIDEGFIAESIATFNTTNIPLATNILYNLMVGSIKGLVTKTISSSSTQIANMDNITTLNITQDIAFDDISVELKNNTPTIYNYTISIPILKDIISATGTLTIGTFASETIIITNGTTTFDVNYNATNSIGIINTDVAIVMSNGLHISKSLTYQSIDDSI